MRDALPELLPDLSIARVEQLLNDFQDAEAKFGDHLFGLFAVTKAEWAELPDWVRHEVFHIGFSGIDASTVYHIVAPGYEQGSLAPRQLDDCAELFKSLAARGGAMLPLSIRNAIQREPAYPVDWWLAFLWWSNPPSDEDLEIDFTRGKNSRVVVPQPFFASIEAIERHLLPAGQASTIAGGGNGGLTSASAAGPPALARRYF